MMLFSERKTRNARRIRSMESSDSSREKTVSLKNNSIVEENISVENIEMVKAEIHAMEGTTAIVNFGPTTSNNSVEKLAVEQDIVRISEKIADDKDVNTVINYMESDEELFTDKTLVADISTLDDYRKRQKQPDTFFGITNNDFSGDEFIKSGTEDNYFEDSWGLHSSMLFEGYWPSTTWMSTTPDKSMLLTSSDQYSDVLLSPSDPELFRICWVSDLESDSEKEATATVDELSKFGQLSTMAGDSDKNAFMNNFEFASLGTENGNYPNTHTTQEVFIIEQTDNNMNEFSFSNSFFETSQTNLVSDA